MRRGPRGHDAVLAEIGRDQIARNALLGELSIVAHAGADDAELDRVEQAPAVRQVVETMPLLAGMQHPAVGIGREQLGWRVYEGDALATRPLHRRRVPG